MKSPTSLYLFRHGEVESRYHKVFGGKIDMELSPLGHEQVKAAADYFQRHPPHVMYASPMKRVQQTLAPLAQWTKLKPIILPGLREVDFGAWTGLSWDEVYQRFRCLRLAQPTRTRQHRGSRIHCRLSPPRR